LLAALEYYDHVNGNNATTLVSGDKDSDEEDVTATTTTPAATSNNGEFGIKLVVREWTEGLKYSHEFRGFVYKNNLTCVSQYDPHCYFEDLQPKVQQLSQLCQDYFVNKARPVITAMLSQQQQQNKNNNKSNTSTSNTNTNTASNLFQYIIDFGVLDNGQVTVIELNATQDYEQDIACAGSGCFSWQQDKDIILGNSPFEFRVHTSPPLKEPKSQVSFDWMKILEDNRRVVLPEFYKAQEEQNSSNNSGYSYCNVL